MTRKPSFWDGFFYEFYIEDITPMCWKGSCLKSIFAQI